MSQMEYAAGNPLPAPGRASQATVIEQTRAAAEVAAAVQVAQQCPRSMQAAITAMTQSCEQKRLAEKAFYSYPKGGKTITGPTVHLARELARCFGNMQHGISELARNDAARESEMLAFAWDVERNTRSSLTFIVPHKRDGSPEDLTSLRDIYENNTNNGARRLRTVILGLLPPWFVDQAVDLCYETLKDGGGVPLPKRIAHAVHLFAQLGATVDQLEQRIGRHPDKWNEYDLAQVGITYRSIDNGELRLEDAFPLQRVTAEEITGRAPVAPPAASPACEACGPLAHHTEAECPNAAG